MKKTIKERYEELRDKYEELSYRFLRLEKDNNNKYDEIKLLSDELRKYKMVVPDFVINQIK